MGGGETQGCPTGRPKAGLGGVLASTLLQGEAGPARMPREPEIRPCGERHFHPMAVRFHELHALGTC